MKANATRSALVEGEDYYWEGAAMVFTARYHLRRGACCGSKCRHCPYAAPPSRGDAAPRNEGRNLDEATNTI